MNLHTATQQVINNVRTAACPDIDTVHSGLQLAVHAWQACDPHPATATHWAMFGVGVCAAIDELGQLPEPIVIVLEDSEVPDTSQVRHQITELAAALAAHLETAAGDPGNDPQQRWAWATAAARLRTAASDLVSWP